MGQSWLIPSTLIAVATVLICLVGCSWGDAAAETAGLTAHNQYRAKHQVGALKLDSFLNSEAQRCSAYYASNKKIDHSCKTQGAGECLYMAWGSQTPPNPANITNVAVKMWYDENKGYNYGNPGASTGVTGHFTQVVWKATTLLGIGVSTINTYTVVVAKYKVTGNMYGGNGGYQYFKENVFPPK